MKIIPAIDLQDGKCVRLYQGDFEKTTVYSENPADIARQFSALHVTDLHIVDLDGARLGSQQNRAGIEAIISETSLVVQLGGGIRERATVAQWLGLGVSRCVIGSMAVRQPDEVADWFGEFGGDCLVLALDVNIGDDETPYLTTHGWTEQSDTSLWSAIDRFLDVGLKHVLCTDVSRDGAMAGPNRFLYDDILDRYPQLALQASGGVRDIDDLVALREAGVPAAITGRALLDGRISAEEVASFPRSA